MGIMLVYFGVKFFALDCSFDGCFCLELGVVMEWILDRMVSMMNEAGGFLSGCGGS